MNSSNIKARARSCLSGRWTTLAVITLVYSIITSAASYFYIGTLIVAGPLSVAMAKIALRVICGDRVSVDNLFDGFKVSFTRNLLLGIVNTLLILLWSLLLIVPGIIKSCAWSMSYFIAAENPGMSQSEARRRSEEMMMGHKMEYFMLMLSFIGWIILSCFTLGIGIFFLAPYMQVSAAAFYDNLKISRFVGDNFAAHEPRDEDGGAQQGGTRFGGSGDGGSDEDVGANGTRSSGNVFDSVFGSSKSSGTDNDGDGNNIR